MASQVENIKWVPGGWHKQSNVQHQTPHRTGPVTRCIDSLLLLGLLNVDGHIVGC
jgi:hypothetical protein